MTQEEHTDEEKVAALEKLEDSLDTFKAVSAADRRVPEPPHVRRARKACRDAARNVLVLLLGRKPTAEELNRIIPL
jgi:hypothetical protein